MAKIYVDGKDAVLGRVGTFVAKELLKGNSVEIVNSEKIIVSGDKRNFSKKIRDRINMGRGGSLKGPKYIKTEDRLVKRIIRGMLPYRKPKGKEAFKKLRCYINNPKKIPDEKLIKIKSKIPFKHSTIKEIVKLI